VPIIRLAVPMGTQTLTAGIGKTAIRVERKAQYTFPFDWLLGSAVPSVPSVPQEHPFSSSVSVNPSGVPCDHLSPERAAVSGLVG
jgi:hypothetical protein